MHGLVIIIEGELVGAAISIDCSVAIFFKLGEEKEEEEEGFLKIRTGMKS